MHHAARKLMHHAARKHVATVDNVVHDNAIAARMLEKFAHRSGMPDGRIPVGAQAVGIVRQLRERLRVEALKLTVAADRIPERLIASAAFKKNVVGAERAWGHILARMPCPPLRMDRERHVGLWRLLRPASAAMANPDGSNRGDQAIIVSWLAIGRGRGRALRQEGPWGLSVTDHALGRLLERTSFQADPVATMEEAHNALLAASSGVARTMLAERRWAIPAGAGAFLATVRGLTSEGDKMILVICETFVSMDQLWDEQLAQVEAIRFRAPGRSLGEGLLLPAVLRPVAVPQVGAARQFVRLPV